MEEVIAFRRRVTGRDELAGQDLSPWDIGLIRAYEAAFASQGLRHGDLGPAFTGALGRHRGDVRAARAETLAAFGRCPSRSYTAALVRAWQAAEAQRRAGALLRAAVLRARLADRTGDDNATG